MWQIEGKLVPPHLKQPCQVGYGSAITENSSGSPEFSIHVTLGMFWITVVVPVEACEDIGQL